MESVRILIVDADSAHAERVRAACDGHAIVARPDGNLAALLAERRPHIIVADGELFHESSAPGKALRAHRLADPNIVAIAVVSPERPDLTLGALKAGAGNFLLRPVDAELLRYLIAKYEPAVRRTEREALLRSLIVEQKERIVMPTDGRLVTPVVEHILGKIEDAVPRIETADIRLGLEEIIRNSVEHGNLEIGFEAKLEALKQYGLEKLVRERMADPRLAARRIAIDYHLDGDVLRVSVEDEGPGFDYRKVWDPLSDEGIHRLNGRGIFLTRAFFDDVRYVGRGNRVELTKRIGAAAN